MVQLLSDRIYSSDVHTSLHTALSCKCMVRCPSTASTNISVWGAHWSRSRIWYLIITCEFFPSKQWDFSGFLVPACPSRLGENTADLSFISWIKWPVFSVIVQSTTSNCKDAKMPRKGTMMASCHEKPPVLKPSPNRLQNLHDPRGDQLVTVLMLDKPPSLEATASVNNLEIILMLSH